MATLSPRATVVNGYVACPCTTRRPAQRSGCALIAPRPNLARHVQPLCVWAATPWPSLRGGRRLGTGSGFETLHPVRTRCAPRISLSMYIYLSILIYIIKKLDKSKIALRSPDITPPARRAPCSRCTPGWAAGRRWDRQGDSFGHCLATTKRTHSGPKKIAPPVDNLKMVTPYPKARATMNETTLSTLVPLGTPIVMHLYTG